MSVIDDDERVRSCTDAVLDPGEELGIAVGSVSIPVGTFAGAMTGAFVGDRIDRD